MYNQIVCSCLQVKTPFKYELGEIYGYSLFIQKKVRIFHLIVSIHLTNSQNQARWQLKQKLISNARNLWYKHITNPTLLIQLIKIRLKTSKWSWILRGSRGWPWGSTPGVMESGRWYMLESNRVGLMLGLVWSLEHLSPCRQAPILK